MIVMNDAAAHTLSVSRLALRFLLVVSAPARGSLGSLAGELLAKRLRWQKQQQTLGCDLLLSETKKYFDKSRAGRAEISLCDHFARPPSALVRKHFSDAHKTGTYCSFRQILCSRLLSDIYKRSLSPSGLGKKAHSASSTFTRDKLFIKANGHESH
jgi:hypothetical protein